ncbi:MAG TPA: iron-containing alcohol dehydrogenase [Spirochaetota bacterium]|nr:iron-containing alcohol dehydrogenase [Spirochaetota bacterium]
MAYDQDLEFIYYGPTRVVFGVGSSREVEVEMSSLGCGRAVVMTDPGIIKAGLLDVVKDTLGKKCVGVFSDIPQDTGVGTVNRAADYAKECGADIIISLGGGSVIDTAKNVCIILKEGGRCEDWQGLGMLSGPVTPHIVIPTTAGTGSEVTFATVLFDETKGQKVLTNEMFNAPRVAILDPKMTEKLPPLLTAGTGMDAMCHAVEALHSLQHEPIADGLAIHAIRLLSRNLPACVDNGSDLVARGQVQIAALLAGWSFGNALVGIVHAMAHSIGAIARVPHGTANGILLPHCMNFNLEDAVEAYGMVAEGFGVRERGMDDLTAAKESVKAMKAFTKRIKHPQKLSEVGVKEADLPRASELCMSDGSILNNPKMVIDSSQVLEIYKKAF